MGKHKRGMNMQRRPSADQAKLVPIGANDVYALSKSGIIQPAYADMLDEIKQLRAKVAYYESPVYRRQLLEQVNETYEPLKAASKEVNAAISIAIGVMAVDAPLDNAREALDTLDITRRLAGDFAELEKANLRFSGQYLSERTHTLAAMMINGLNLFISEKDDGEALRTALAYAVPELQQAIEELLPRGQWGRGKGPDSKTLAIGRAGIRRRQIPGHENESGGETYLGIISELERSTDRHERDGAAKLRKFERKRLDEQRGKSPGEEVNRCIKAVIEWEGAQHHN